MLLRRVPFITWRPEAQATSMDYIS